MLVERECQDLMFYSFATIIVLTKNGLSQCQIAEQVGCSKTAVKKTQDKYRATNSITDMARSGHPQVTTERTDRHIAILSKSDRFKQATAIRNEFRSGLWSKCVHINGEEGSGQSWIVSKSPEEKTSSFFEK